MTQRAIYLCCLSAAFAACASELEPSDPGADEAVVMQHEAERDAVRAAALSDVGVLREALTASRLNVPVDRRHFGGNILVEDHYYTVGTDCAEGYERDRVQAIKTSGNGFCAFSGWESPDDIHDCRARIHAQTNAFWGGVWCETSVFEKLSERASCCAAHAEPGCDDSTPEYPNIEECVCERDSYCCSTAWDEFCVAEVPLFGCAPRNYCR
jgi:hypothetical protein